MSYLFASSHLPDNRVRRPEDEEEDESLQPELRSGMVRAFSHLPAKKEAGDPAGPLAQRIGRQLQRTGIENEGTPHEDGIAAAKASGVFDAVRQQYNRGDSPHYMDEEGKLRPRDETRPPDSFSPRDPRSPQSGAGAGAPPRPAWDAGHGADDEDPNQGESFRTSPPASVSEDTRPWYMPAITHEDLNSQHFDEDATDSPSAPESRPEVHDLVYRTPGASKPKPDFSDLAYRSNGSAEEAGDHPSAYFQNAAASANAKPKPAQQTTTHEAAPDNRASYGYYGSQPAAPGSGTATDSAKERLSRINLELERANQAFEKLLAEQRKHSEKADQAKYVLEQNQKNIESLKGLRMFLKGTKNVQDKTMNRLPKPMKVLLKIIMEESGADPAAQIKNLETKIMASEGRTAENEKSVKEAEDALRKAIEQTQEAGRLKEKLEKQPNQPELVIPG